MVLHWSLTPDAFWPWVSTTSNAVYKENEKGWKGEEGVGGQMTW